MKDKILEKIAKIEASDFKDTTYSIKQLKDIVENGNYTLTYELDHKEDLIAYLIVFNYEYEKELLKIWVDPERRRQRHATRLLEPYKNEKLLLEVDATNEKAISFYTNLGFKPYYRRKKYYNGRTDAILMRKN